MLIWRKLGFPSQKKGSSGGRTSSLRLFGDVGSNKARLIGGVGTHLLAVKTCIGK